MMKKGLKETSIILIGMLVAISSYSSLFGQVVSIDKNNYSHVDISNCLEIATDSTGDWNFEYVANNKQIWTPITGEILNFGMTQNTHWCKK
jgi:hypothetical protein